MKKIFLILIFCFSFSLFIIPVEAKSAFNSSISSSIYILDDDDFHGISNVEESGIDVDKYNKKQDCDSIFGNRDDDSSVMWLIDKALKVVQIVGPIMVVVLSSIDFAKVIVSGDDEAMAKAGKKLGIRLVLAAALFFIPVLVNAILSMFGLTGNAACGIE